MTANNQSINNAKILIVEDDDAIRQLYEIKLKNEGFITKSAINGLLGLRAAKEFAPDLILLDLRMPVMSGDEMLLKLRESDWGSEARVIILTNISKSEAPHSLRFLHVDRYIVKVHTTPAQVVETVKEVLA
jgi:DNA-binding response OmpR family regulator